jgi:hypothetical protein
LLDFRLLRRSALDPRQLTASRYDIEVDLPLALLGQESRARGAREARGPQPRAHGTSPLRDGTRILWRIFGRRFGSLRLPDLAYNPPLMSGRTLRLATTARSGICCS